MPCDAEDMVIFEEWMKYRNKSYKTEDEKLKRFQEFKVSLREAESVFPQTKNPMWEHLSIFADITDEEFFPAYTGLDPESDEDEKNGVFGGGLDEKYMTDSDDGSDYGCFGDEKYKTTGVKHNGQCCCDEKDTKEEAAPE